MHSFFSRHEGNQTGGEGDAGYIAWLLWGGDAGRAWSARKAAQIDQSESARGAERKATMAKYDNDLFTVQLRWNGMGAPQHRSSFRSLAQAEKEAERLHRLYGSLGNPDFPSMKGIVEIEVFDAKQPWKNRTVRWFASRSGAKARFDLRAKVQQMKATVSKLANTLGFKPDDVTGNDEMMHIMFENQPKQADRLASALRSNLARVGVPSSAITTHEHHYADDNTTYGGVWIDLKALATASDKMSRLGAKARFGGTWTTKSARYGAKKATVEFYTNNGMVGSVYQDPDNPRMYKAFTEPEGREIASGSRETCKAAVEKLAMARRKTMHNSLAKAKFGPANTVIVKTVLSGTGGSGGIFKVIGYDKNGREHEYGMFAMRSMAEEKARWVADLMGYAYKASRPGAKAKFNRTPTVQVVPDDGGVGDGRARKGWLIVYYDENGGVRQWHRDSLSDAKEYAQSIANHYKARLMSRPGAKAAFGSSTAEVHRTAKSWLARVNRTQPPEGLEQFHARLTTRLAEIVRVTGEMIRNPQMIEDYGGWSDEDLMREVRKIGGGSNVANRWLAVNLGGSSLGGFSRANSGGKSAFAENVTYSVAVHIGNQPAGERSTKSLEEAKAYAKAMLETAKANAKGKPVVVDVYPVVNYEPKDAVLTLRASRPGAKAAFAWRVDDVREAKQMTDYFVSRIAKMDPESGASVAQIHLNSLLSALDEAMSAGTITRVESQEMKKHALDAYRSKFSRPGAKAAMSRPGEADAFALGAASEATRPEQDESLTALAAKVGREHTVSLFKRWTEGKASMSRNA